MDENTGIGNTGYRNTGNKNIGHRNTGNRNTGDYNTGCENTGNGNTGYWNTGNWNTGDGNKGDFNSGYFNAGSHNTGFFNTEEPKKINVFDKELEMTANQFYVKYRDILRIMSRVFDEVDKMVIRENFKRLSSEEKSRIKELPNFNVAKFYKCTGLNIHSY